MPLNTRRLRRWLVLAIALLLIVVGAFYSRGYYGRYLLSRVIKNKAEKLGIDIQQSTQGFAYSKSEGGRTLFTIRASKAVQLKAGSAGLHDVNIVIYGRERNRFDQIYGADFEYEPKTGDVKAMGEVHIDLQGVAEGEVRPDMAPPKELKNPIHVKTSGLVFNRNSGIANTDEQIEFRIPQASGSAIGATYDSKANQLTLHSQIHLENGGADPAKLDAHSGVITKDPARVEFHNAHIVRASSDVTAQVLTVYLRKDNTIEQLLATGNVDALVKGKTSTHAKAPRGEIHLDAKNKVQNAELSGGVTIDSAGDQPMHGTAGRVLLDFAANNQLDRVHAVENVKLVQEPPKNHPLGQTTVLTSQSVDFLVNKAGQRRAETQGKAQIAMTSPADAPNASNTVATADRFIQNFDKKGRLTTLVGSPNAKVVSSSVNPSGKSAAILPDKVTTSNVLTLTMNPNGGVANIVQEGNFRYVEAAAKQGQAGSEATAQKATYDPQTEMFVLSGSPRVSDNGVTTTADRMRINRRTGDAIADGSVKTTYSQLQGQPNGALLATSDPIHVTAANMVAKRTTEIARYTGGARLWQGSNIVEALTIDFNRGTRTVTAEGETAKPVSTVFVEQGQNGKQTPVNVTGLRLTYADAQRLAKFEGGVVMRGAEGTVTADRVTVYLQPHGSLMANTPAKSASELDKIVAEGHVVIQQPQRRGTGNRLTYTAKDGSFTLTGDSPSIFDAERGKVTGDSLTFFSRDDRVLVEGGSTTQSVTKARVIK
jgi:lipopolysaccharide export system protein LptA